MKQSIQREVRAELDEFRSTSEEELQDAQARDLADSEEMARIEDEEGMYRRRLMLSGVDPDTRERYTLAEYQAILCDLDPDWEERRTVDISLAGGDADLDFLDENDEEFRRHFEQARIDTVRLEEANRGERALTKRFIDSLSK